MSAKDQNLQTGLPAQNFCWIDASERRTSGGYGIFASLAMALNTNCGKMSQMLHHN
jgi:hypothetical protein